MIHTYNEYRLGDQLVHLNFLRRAWDLQPLQEFTHHCNPAYHPQLQDIIEDTSIQLADLSIPPGCINAWIGANNFFYEHPKRANWVEFHLDWFSYLSTILGIRNPMAGKGDLLFNYPRLNSVVYPHFDYLIINSPPTSGQLPDYHPNLFTNLVREHLNNGKTVITTYPTGMCECTLDRNMTVTQIGNLSNYCDHIIGVATGPMWTTFNTFNHYSVLSRTFYCAHQTVNLTESTITKHSML